MQSDIVSMPTNIFSGCSSLENLTLNENIAEFSYGCFNGCSSLTDLDFVSNGVLLQSYAFNGTGAESVVLSDSLLASPDASVEDYREFMEERPPKFHIDLKRIIRHDLEMSGVSPQNISDMGLCTKCHKDVFYSHRGHHGKRGLMAAAMIMV